MGFMSAKPPDMPAAPAAPKNPDETGMRAFQEQRRRLLATYKGGTALTGPLGVMGKAPLAAAKLLGGGA